MFARNEQAVAAIEFAFVFPIVILLLIGLCDLGEALISDRKMVETAEALVRVTSALMTPAQCTVTSWTPSPTQSCSSASLSASNIQIVQNVLNISMGISNISNVNASVFRVVNNNGTYTVTNTFVISGTGSGLSNMGAISIYLPNGGSTLVAAISYSQKLMFPLLNGSISLSTSYSL